MMPSPLVRTAQEASSGLDQAQGLGEGARGAGRAGDEARAGRLSPGTTKRPWPEDQGRPVCWP